MVQHHLTIRNTLREREKKTWMEWHQFSYGDQLISFILNSIKTANNQREEAEGNTKYYYTTVSFPNNKGFQEPRALIFLSAGFCSAAGHYFQITCPGLNYTPGIYNPIQHLTQSYILHNNGYLNYFLTHISVRWAHAIAKRYLTSANTFSRTPSYLPLKVTYVKNILH